MDGSLCIWKFIEERHSHFFGYSFFRLFTRWPPCVLLLAAAYLHNEPQRVSLFFFFLTSSFSIAFSLSSAGLISKKMK
jgi:hypothetical protein